MNKEIIEENNDNIYNDKTIITTPKDGFVPEHEIKPNKFDTVGKYHKGYSTTVTHTTNNPKITRPFVYLICGIFFFIGVIWLLLGNWIFGIPFTLISSFAFYKSKRDIDAIATELKKQGEDVTIDSKQELKDVTDDIRETLKNDFKEVTSSTFTKENFNWFAKTTLPIYIIISSILTLLITFFVNVILGIMVLIITIIVGILYYYIVSKICKY